MKERVYISAINDLVTDQRVHRIAGSIRDSGYEVTLVGRRFSYSQNVNLRGIKIKRFRLWFNKGFLFYASYNIRLFFFLLFRPAPMVLVSNDLDTLPANFLVSRLRWTRLVYDSHEYFTEVPELTGRRFVKKFWSVIERLLVPAVDAAYTVNESLAKMYSVRYGIEFAVIRNVPDTDLEEEAYDIPKDFRENGFLIYQGALNRDRGLENLIDIVAESGQLRLIIAGDGDVIDSLQERVRIKHAEDRIHFTGKIRPGKLKGITRHALLGLSLERKTNLNYYYALPNKLFDYIRAGIPVLCSAFPEMSKIVNEQKVGLTVNPSDSESIKKLIDYMIQDSDERKMWIQNTKKASEELIWKVEQAGLRDIYRKAGLEIHV